MGKSHFHGNTQAEDETELEGLEQIVIMKGEYKSIMIKDFMHDIGAIVQAFQKLI